jgi:hypothetical protein
MTRSARTMELANLVCKFGDHKVLLDLVSEVVIPSFTDAGLQRSYDQTRYFFHKTQLIVLARTPEPVLGIAGRFIKDTVLEREQYFEKNDLVSSPDSIKSAPSALFVLILNNHRLLYMKETRQAPSMEAFRATLDKFLKEKHKKFIDEEYRLRKPSPSGKRLRKKDLLEIYPFPTLELVPLTEKESIESFIKKYQILQSMEISLAERNDESDNDPFFEALQKKKDNLGSKRTTVKHINMEGLDKDEAAREVARATEQGTQRVTLKGTDSSGDLLSGNNEEFQLKKPISIISNEVPKAAQKLYESFKGLVDGGLVKFQAPSPKALEAVMRLFREQR